MLCLHTLYLAFIYEVHVNVNYYYYYYITDYQLQSTKTVRTRQQCLRSSLEETKTRMR